MIGMAVAAGMKAASGIIGGIAARRARNKMKKNIQTQMAQNQDWYDRRYNEDATQRADAQRLLTITEENIKNRNRQAAGTAAVMGGADESVAAEKEANNKALANTMSNINAAADARKESIEQQYMSTKANLNNQLNQLNGQQAQDIRQAANGVADSAGSFAGLFDKEQ